jgi:hypothetical protein
MTGGRLVRVLQWARNKASARTHALAKFDKFRAASAGRFCVTSGGRWKAARRARVDGGEPRLLLVVLGTLPGTLGLLARVDLGHDLGRIAAADILLDHAPVDALAALVVAPAAVPFPVVSIQSDEPTNRLTNPQSGAPAAT